MKRKSIMAILLATVMTAGMLSGCGESTQESGGSTQSGQADTTEGSGGDTTASSDGKDASDSSGDNAADQASESGDGTGTAAASSDITSPDSAIGEWAFMCSLYHSEDEESEQPYDYVTMCTDEMAPEASIIITKEGDKYKADYKFREYEYGCMIYGADLAIKDGAPYAEASDRTWYLELEDPFRYEDSLDENFKMSMKQDGMLEVSIEYNSPDDAEYKYHSLTKNYYLRKDAPEFDNPEELRYFDEVTVSNAVDLMNSIQNNRKIICEAGTYNFTDIMSKISNPKMTSDYRSCIITNIYNLGIVAKEGADVQFCIDEPYDPVLTFQTGGNITIRGITCGHTVEPGYCSGSVISFDSISRADIDKCKLYGSGTYGVEAVYTSNLTVTDTDIYECTYGLLDLRNVSNAQFKNCNMRDSSDLSMINVNSCYEVNFEDCVFSGNRADAYDTCYFVELGEYDTVKFKNCAFNNNSFNAFANREVTLENCTSDNNQSGLSDLINASRTGGVPDKATILNAYDAAKTRAKEIDERFQSETLMDQQTMNQLSFEEYNLWDGLLNQIWEYLKENLDQEKFDALTTEQQKWIKEKENAMKEAGTGFEGGTMQPMVEYGAGSSATEKRVEELMDQFIR